MKIKIRLSELSIETALFNLKATDGFAYGIYLSIVWIIAVLMFS